MHAADLSRSPRLRRVLDVLKAHPDSGMTTLELVHWTGSCAVHSDIAELRANGIKVGCTYEGTRNGRRVYRYRLEDRAA
jgi:hypothetical protein